MNKAPEISLYDQLKFIDVIDPILEPYMQGKVIADIETKRLSLHKYIALNRVWIFAKVCQDRKCAKWLGIYNSFYKIFPPPCKQCWKVVYAPQSLTELIEVQKLQDSQGLPSKCGTEARDYTSGLGGYRAFWYCPFYAGLDGARAHFERVKSALIKHFGETFILDRLAHGKLFLKRGCTELERDFGPSDTWDQIDHSAKFRLLEAVWEDPQEMIEEWGPLKYTNLKRWIEFAVAHGDPDALNYVHGKVLGVPAVKYHDSEHKADQFKNFINSLNEPVEGGNGNGSKREENLFRLES